jgi:DNA polymerase III sliding clamp (beta) subunit (PCNA family)
MIKVDANLFRAAAVCMSKEETRYYLQGVFIEPHAVKGVTMTATDGHRLICVHDENGTASESAIIKLSPDALKACRPKRNETCRQVTIDGLDATVTAITGADENAKVERVAITANCRVDGTFPDYRRVVPNVTNLESYKPDWYNGQYIASFADIADILADHENRIKLATNSPGSPAIVLFSASPHAFGVIMPCRGSNAANIPEWFNAKPAKLQAAE